MIRTRTARALLIAIGAALLIFTTGRRASAAPWETKVDPWVLGTAAAGTTEFIVFLTEQADLRAAAGLPDKTQKGAFVFAALVDTAARTQGPLLAQLAALDVEHRAYWVANFIWVRAGADVVQVLAERDDVAHIYANPWVALDIEPQPEGESPAAVEWNILKVNADDVWAAGVTGDGAVIAGQDTGYDWNHPALIGAYRGWNGSSADHGYHWHDAIHSDGGVCGSDSPEPCDDNGHGTHTMGIMVGDDGGSNQIGMAPRAKWIGCRNMDEGVGTPTTYSECFQWFIAPTDLNGQNPDPDMAPHVINNSWACPFSEGCTDPNALKTVVENTRAAGIVVVASAGNSGPNCTTIQDPAAIYEASFTVGSTNNLDQISGFSSRGPVTVDDSGRLKPDVSAPGSAIRSSFPGTGYVNMSGTSMAGPHVAGLVGLLVSAVPELAGQVGDLEDLIEGSAVGLTGVQECGGIPGSQIPNNTFGHGRIDAFAAYEAALLTEVELLIYLPPVFRGP
ncbi:MAG TPA: S8 family serine peptidase [Anaerolineales bacterium]|nr:S8 family serine peptidase [Anaerolineales bacterium]